MSNDDGPIVLGNNVRHKVSGYSGTVVSITKYLYGLPLYGVQPTADNSNNLPSVEYFYGDALSLG